MRNSLNQVIKWLNTKQARYIAYTEVDKVKAARIKQAAIHK